MPIITIANHKGGVGKTCSVSNIGAALAMRGHKVCLIDLDPQSHLTASFGIEPKDTIYTALRGDYKVTPVTINDKLFLVPSDIDLSAAEMELSSEPGREYLLKEFLKTLSYDFLLIDCPPSLGLLTINALTAADHLLIPLQSEFLALKGMTKLVDVIEKVQRRLNPALKFSGVFLTQFDSRKTLNRRVQETVEARFPNKVLKTIIRSNVALAEAPAASKDIFSYSPKSNGAIDYDQLTTELLGVL